MIPPVTAMFPPGVVSRPWAVVSRESGSRSHQHPGNKNSGDESFRFAIHNFSFRRYEYGKTQLMCQYIKWETSNVRGVKLSKKTCGLRGKTSTKRNSQLICQISLAGFYRSLNSTAFAATQAKSLNR
jgi:hypothetical protein